MTNISPDLNAEGEVPDLGLARTALFDEHRKSGGKIVPFAGWELPVQYAGLKAETLAVREGCGIFDVSHMGQLDVRGEGVTEALNAIISADWSRVDVGRAAYGLLLNESGGVIDDVMGYHISDRHWLIVVNASRAQVDEEHFRVLLPPTIELSSRAAGQAMIAIQGPRAEEFFQYGCLADLSEMRLRDVVSTRVLASRCIVGRGGYTGCDGFEWIGEAADAPRVWRALLAEGAVPCGLGARDVLRLEAGLPLYGHELREDLIPDESNVNFAVKTEKGSFFGRAGLVLKREGGISVAITGLLMEGRAVAREGYLVQLDGEEIGVVTSGTPSPTLEQNIALALLPNDLPIGTQVQVMVRNAPHPARIVALPFVPRSTKMTPN